VTVTFEVGDASQHYHVPLLVSPYGYTTYRAADLGVASATGSTSPLIARTLPPDPIVARK
jgi:hypothetical protein